ncbi:PREDICTED: uncharacterized protein LOC108759419 [Trachymyrmex cornetzi]|uniref:uncharacterized protein LOC108759419 n=1 Tax=Trachymyrmex cornetzi TaxID=471704 RepID=UPI00084F2C0C|nr:PREDICTED: uncharacterized protein LOC108759419 [Trachymyrmex cornetzi]
MSIHQFSYIERRRELAAAGKCWHRAELHKTWKSDQATTFTIREPYGNCRLKTDCGYLRISAVCLTAKDFSEFLETLRNHFVKTTWKGFVKGAARGQKKSKEREP